jgi:hypothetical protein
VDGLNRAAQITRYTFRAIRIFFVFDVSGFPHDSGHGSSGWTRLVQRAQPRCLTKI